MILMDNLKLYLLKSLKQN